MRQIAQSQGNHCVERAISVMRLCLGYDTGLPKDWPCDIKKTEMILTQLVSHAFPDHKIKVWESIERDFNYGPNVTRVGSTFSNFDDWNNHLSAFCYCSNEKTAHIVVGDPCIYEGMKTSFVMAIELEE